MWDWGGSLWLLDQEFLGIAAVQWRGGWKKESEDKQCDGVVGWCRFGVIRNVCKSMAEVWIENLGQMGFKFQGEETRKGERNLILEKWDFKEKKERVWRDFKIFEDKFVFWLYERLKCWCVFFVTHVIFSLDLEIPHGCWLAFLK